MAMVSRDDLPSKHMSSTPVDPLPPAVNPRNVEVLAPPQVKAASNQGHIELPHEEVGCYE